jgi:hypothetical protein
MPSPQSDTLVPFDHDPFAAPSRPPRIINFEGRRINLPHDATDNEVRTILSAPPNLATPLGKLRQQYPQYNDLGDQQLADALHAKHYADMPREQFYVKIGLASQGPTPDMDPMAGSSPSFGPEMPRPATLAEREGRSFKIGLQGTGGGVAKVLGMPVDLATGAINLGVGAVNDATALVGRPTNFQGVRKPFLGSENIQDAASGAAKFFGYEPVREETFSPTEKLQHNIADYGTQAMTASGALAKAAAGEVVPALQRPAADLGGRVADVFKRPYRDAPARTFAGDAAGGAGSGVAVDALDNVVPKESPYRPISEMGAVFGGNVAGTTALGVVEGLGRMLRTLASNRITDTNVPVNQTSGKPYTVAEAERAARAFQETAHNPGLAAREIRANADDLANATLPGETPMSRGEMPTSGLLSHDPGLVSAEYNRARRDPQSGPAFIERDQAVKAGAADRVESLKDPAADQMAPRRVAEHEAQTRIGEARSEAMTGVQQTERQANDVLTRARAAAESAVQQARQEAEAGVVGAQGRLQAAEQSLREVERQAQQQGAPIAAVANTEAKAQASQRLDRTLVDENYIPARTEKNRQFDEAPGRNDQLPADNVIAAAREVQSRINALAPGGLQMPGEFVQRLRRLEPNMQEIDGQMVNAGGPGTAQGADLADLRKYLGTAHEQAQRTGNFDLADSIQTLRRSINETLQDAPGYAEANANYGQFADRYRLSYNDEGAKFTRQVDRDPQRGSTPPSKTADRFLAGPEKVESLQRMLADDPNGINAVRDHLRSDFGMSTLNPDGTINANRAAAWGRNNAAVLERFPQVRAEFDDMLATARRGDQLSAQAQTNIDEARRALPEITRQGAQTVRDVERVGTRGVRDIERQGNENIRNAERTGQEKVRNVEQDVERSAAGTLLREDPRDVAQRLLGTKRYGAEKQLGEINALVASDPVAQRGWKAAVAESLYDRVSSTRQVGETYEIQFQRLAKEFKDNEQLLATVFSPEEMNTLRQGHKLLEYFKESEKRASLGSNTADTQMIPGAVQLVFRHIYGDLKGGGIIKRFKLLMEQLPSNRNSAEEIARMAWFDPELAAYLLEKPLRANPTTASRPLRRVEALAAGGRESGREHEDK